MKYIYLVIGVWLLSACSTTYPPYRAYELQKSADVVQKSQACKETLRVAKVNTSPLLMRKKMYYVSGMESYSYTESEWTKRPSEFITESFLEAVAKSNAFSSVIGEASKAKNRYLLESRVETFMQYYNEVQTDSYAKIAVTFFLIDAGSGEIVKSMHFEKEQPCVSADAKGGVKALNALLNDASKALSEWIVTLECKA